MAETPIKHDSNKDIYRGEFFVFCGGLPLAFCTDATLELTTEEVDVSNKMCAGNWSVSLPGKKSYTVTAEALITMLEGALSFDTLLDKQIAGETLEFAFAGAKVTEESETGGKFEVDTTKKHYKGTVMITSQSLKSTYGQIASSSTNFKGVGALIPVDGIPGA